RRGIDLLCGDHGPLCLPYIIRFREAGRTVGRRHDRARRRWTGAGALLGRELRSLFLVLVFLLRAPVFQNLALLPDRHFHFLLLGGLQDDLEAAVDFLLVLDLRDLHDLLHLGLGVFLLHRGGDGFGELLGVELLFVVLDRAVFEDVSLGLLAVLLRELDVV